MDQRCGSSSGAIASLGVRTADSMRRRRPASSPPPTRASALGGLAVRVAPPLLAAGRAGRSARPRPQVRRRPSTVEHLAERQGHGRRRLPSRRRARGARQKLAAARVQSDVEEAVRRSGALGVRRPRRSAGGSNRFGDRRSIRGAVDGGGHRSAWAPGREAPRRRRYISSSGAFGSSRSSTEPSAQNTGGVWLRRPRPWAPRTRGVVDRIGCNAPTMSQDGERSAAPGRRGRW